MKTQLLNLWFWFHNPCGELGPPRRTRIDSGLLAALLALAGCLPSAAAAQLVSWGQQMISPVPPGTGFTAIAAGVSHDLALMQDGTVVAWGVIYPWRVEVPATVPSGLSGVTAIAAGYDHSLALKLDGTVVVWGSNEYGQTNVPSGLSGVIAIAAGDDHSLALKLDGTVVAWGFNSVYGGATVPNGLSGVIAVAAGSLHSLALKLDGTVVAWGSIFNGTNYLPATVPNGLGGVIAIAAGGAHSLALKQDGTVVAWGGIPYHAPYYKPATVPSGLNGVIAIAAGWEHSLALKQDGTVVAWENNVFGQTNVPSGLSGVTAIAAGGEHSLALVYARPPAPEILTPPQSQTAEAGSTIRLHVLADSGPPLSYQWFFNQTNPLSQGTNSFLTLLNVQPSQAGAYAVVVTNLSGAVTSAPAMLSVIPPVPRKTVPAINLTGDVGSFLYLSYADTPGLSASWQALDAVTLTNSQQIYLDLSEPLPPYRFYRAWQTNLASVNPALQMRLATEIPLSGSIDNSVRIDYINAIGPTNAWATLDTVLLTNTTQLYFDLTTFGRPTRLYRLVSVP